MKKIENIPDELCFPPGLIGDVARFVIARSRLKHPEFALNAGIVLLSVLAGRKAIDETGTTPGVYTLNLGPTGCGKEAPREVVKEILQPTKLLSSERFTSDSAFVNELMSSPSMLCCSDEVGNMIEELSSNRASQNVKNLCDAMAQCYTSSRGIWNYKGFADNSRTKTVPYPNFVLFGSGNASSLFRGLRPEQISNGFLGRFLLFLSDNGGGRARRIAKFAVDPQNPNADEFSPLLEIPEAVTKFINTWISFKTHEGNLESASPKPHVVNRTLEAKKRIEQHYENINNRLHEEQGTIRGDIWARASEKTAKFSLLAALSRSADLIDIQDANWAIELTNFLTRRLIQLASRHVAESSWDLKALEILRRIQDHGRPIEHSVLLKSSRVKSKEFQDFISWLQETGDVILAVKSSKGRPCLGYACSATVFDKIKDWKIITKEDYEQAKKAPKT